MTLKKTKAGSKPKPEPEAKPELAYLESGYKRILKRKRLWNDVVINELGKKHAGDIKAREIIFLCALGRLVANKKPFSFNVIVHASSSAGKDHLVSSVLQLFPEGDYETLGRVSPKALNYLHTSEDEPNFTYDGKVLYMEEVEEDTLNNEVMRVFTAGTTRAAIVGDSKKIKILEVKGKPVVITTTATTIPTEEILNRFMIVKLDESEEQTKRTFMKDEEEYSNEIKEAISKLEKRKVVVPFKNKIAKIFPTKRIRSRRDFPRFLDYVKAVAILHQEQRDCDHEGRIKAELKDYQIAKDVYTNAYTGIADIELRGIDKAIVTLLEKASEARSAGELHDSMSKGMIALKNLYAHLSSLTNKGILDCFELEGMFNHITKKYALSEEMKKKKPIVLPDTLYI